MNGAFIRLFVGVPYTSALRAHLSHSQAWKNARLDPNCPLLIIEHQGKEYVGSVLAHDQIPLAQLKQHEAEIKKQLEPYCPSLNFDEIPCVIFPQQYVM